MADTEKTVAEIVVVENYVREDRMGRVVIVRAPAGTAMHRMRYAARKACTQRFTYAHHNRNLSTEKAGQLFVAFELSNMDMYRGSH